MKKTLTILCAIGMLISQNIFANEKNEKLVLDFAKHNLQNANIEFKDLKILSSKTIDKNWEVITINFSAKENGSFKTAKEDLIVNGNYIVSDAMNLKTGKGLREIIAPKLPESIYKEAIFIGGNKNAKNKILVFSDPFCPFCKEEIKKVLPRLDKADAALYMIQIPLNIHPASNLTLKHILASKDKIEALKKVYFADVGRSLVTSRDFDKINKWFNETTGEHLTRDDINKKTIDKKIKNNMKIAEQLKVKGTPAVYLNGSIDPKGEQLRKILF